MEYTTVTLPQLRKIAHKLRETSVNCIELQGKDWSVRMTCATPLPQIDPAVTASSEDRSAIVSVCAPMPGQLLLRHPLLESDYVRVGMQVKEYDLLALIKVGTIYLPIRSPLGGTLISLTVIQWQTVEYGREIFRIRENAPL